MQSERTNFIFHGFYAKQNLDDFKKGAGDSSLLKRAAFEKGDTVMKSGHSL